jgi:DNA repair exonuclease SbcCD ATPase subunit
MSINDIYKAYFDLQQKYFVEFSKKVEKFATSAQTGEYIQKICADMEKELETILETNKDYYDEWFSMEYNKLEQELGKLKFESIAEIKLFILSYTSTFKNCLADFLKIPNSDFCQNLINVLSKIFQNFVVAKLSNIGDKINEMYENYSQECNNNIDNLNNNIKKLNEQIDNNKKLLNDNNKEKSEVNKNYLELETKLDKLTRELKTKEQEFENNLNIEKQNFQKMEAYNNAQIKEKDETISQLETKIEKLVQDLQGSNKESFMKATELNRENIKLQSEIERLKKEGGKGKSDVYNEQSANLQTLFKNIQSTFMEFKESVDKLDKENENIFKTKYLENSTKEIEDKLKSCVTELRTFCENQVKSMNDHYQKEIKKVKDQYEQLNFELTKKNAEVQEQIDQKEESENKLKETNKQITELQEISNSKDSLIKTQGEALKIYEDKVQDYIKQKENLEMSLAKSIYDFKMKEDEFDSLFMVIEGIIARKKDKYEHNLTKLSTDVKNTLQSLVKQYKFFK